MAGIGRIFVTMVILFLLVGALSILDISYGTQAHSATLNNSNAQSYNTLTAKVYNPLATQVSTAVNQSNNNFAGASAANGFGWAFIINNFGSMYTEITQAPAILATNLGALIDGLGLNNFGINTSVLTGAISLLFGLFLAVFAIEMWMHSPGIW